MTGIPPKLSIIVPNFRDGELAEKNLKELHNVPGIEVIVVDAKRAGRANRAFQMNWGAAKARGELLVFLHADTRIDPNDLENLYHQLKKRPACIGGAFRFALNVSHPKARLIELGVLLRELAFRLPYGDQSIFVWKKIFQQIGGYPDVRLLEDVLLIEKMKSRGRLYLAPAKAVTSARRWERHGYLKTTLVNWGTMILWKSGLPLKALRGFRERILS